MCNNMLCYFFKNGTFTCICIVKDILMVCAWLFHKIFSISNSIAISDIIATTDIVFLAPIHYNFALSISIHCSLASIGNVVVRSDTNRCNYRLKKAPEIHYYCLSIWQSGICTNSIISWWLQYHRVNASHRYKYILTWIIFDVYVV